MWGRPPSAVPPSVARRAPVTDSRDERDSFRNPNKYEGLRATMPEGLCTSTSLWRDALGGRHRPCVLLRLLIELRLALLRAEVEFLPGVLGLILRIIFVNVHAANRVLCHRFKLLI